MAIEDGHFIFLKCSDCQNKYLLGIFIPGDEVTLDCPQCGGKYVIRRKKIE